MFHFVQQIHKLIYQANENNSISQLGLSLLPFITRASQGKKLALRSLVPAVISVFIIQLPNNGTFYQTI